MICMKSYINKIEAINQFFQSPIIDLDLIQKYLNTFNFSLFQDVRSVLESKKKVRQAIAEVVSSRIAHIYSIKPQKCVVALSSQKNTDITQFWTNLLIPSEGNRLLIQKFRMKLLFKLRKQEQLSEQEIFIVKNFYQLMMQNTIKKTLQIEQLKNSTQPNLLKRILISLKKMMGIGKHQAIVDIKTKRAKRKAYLINVDIKQVVKESLTIIETRSLKDKLQAFLSQKKEKNWFGPNLYKFFKNSDFNSVEIRQICKALQSVNIEQLSLNTGHHQMKRTLKKILNNISFLVKDLKPVNSQSPRISSGSQLLDLPLYILDSQKDDFSIEKQSEQMEQIDDESMALNKEDHLFEYLCLNEQL